MLKILALPAKPVAQPFQLDAQLFEGAMFSEASDANFHELKEPQRLATPMGADGETDGAVVFPFPSPVLMINSPRRSPVGFS